MTRGNAKSSPAHGRRRSWWPRATGAGLLAVALTLPAACTAESDEPEAVSTPSSVVLKPGKPGEPAETVAPDEFDGVSTEDQWNAADAEFMTGMIHHHDQAVVMTTWASEQAASEQLKTFADRMHNTQRAEIGLMSDWLAERDQPVPVLAENADGTGPRAPEGSHEHEPALRPGMLSDAEMAELEAASGAEFDRLFLEGMIKHHKGAIAMCSDVVGAGIDQSIQKLAADIGVDQAAEIDRMEDMLAGL
ncbi:DUF305 domain-containing protein [Myceligenerans xiligouense]|uniref:Uncharacterized protein (DUF305 family) n=1 Tax=Myceligenerans xiligouense TaxID=253184 RepID=A0A3N4YXD0_9MICO|nr:DUF305 domain-containing protein [Myceligenerans xiligouense]RPF23320.1 uncharacterized protein (DUF305 family) [Myceligenerans xiligouense]